MTAYNFSQILPFSKHPPKYEGGLVYETDFEYTLTGALVAADTLTTPADALPDDGINIIEVLLIYPELDTNATPTGTFDVGDATDADRFIAVAPMGVAGVTTAGFQMRQGINRAQGLTNGVPSTGEGYLYPVGTSPQLVVTVGGTVATGATTGFIKLRVRYLCSGEQ